ncbi:hypothetical protein QIS74_10033 [Colletotrichum tabaci]|uniref:Uncharacterized protein n=1 Tax=Colletotrichum tabaci TaxID=1209068 RepID=A0AAV9T2Y3_9PEZI
MTLEPPFEYYERRDAIVEGAENAIITFRAAQDLGRVVLWPSRRVALVSGASLTMRQFIPPRKMIRGCWNGNYGGFHSKLLERRQKGGPFTAEKLTADNLGVGLVTCEGFEDAQNCPFSDPQEMPSFCLYRVFLLSSFWRSRRNAFEVLEEWNKLLPNPQFTQPEESLTKAWTGTDAGAKAANADH